MDAHQAGYLVGRLACLVVPLLLIVGLVVLGVVLLVRKGRPTTPPHHPGGFLPRARDVSHSAVPDPAAVRPGLPRARAIAPRSPRAR